jgi:hypothetical protein
MPDSRLRARLWRSVDFMHEPRTEVRSHGPGASHLDGRLEETAHAGHKAVNRDVGVRARSCSASLRPTNRLPKILTLDLGTNLGIARGRG